MISKKNYPPKPIKSTIAIYYPSLGNGGVQRVISLLVPIYIKLGYRIVIITEYENSEMHYELPQEVKRYVLTKSIEDKKYCDEYEHRADVLKSILKREQVKIYCHHNAHCPILFKDMQTVSEENVYFVLIKHQVFSSELLWGKNYYSWYKENLKACDKVVVLSQLEEIYWRSLGVDAMYIPNPENTNISKTTKGRNSIIWEGRLDRYAKNYLDAVDIMKYVVEELPGAKMRIYGSGGPIEQYELKQKISNLSLEDNIEYCGYTTDMDEIYRDAGVHLVTSNTECFPMGIFEGKAYGIPLVTYDLPQVELLREKKGYISVEPRDIKSAATAIVQILKDGELRKKLSREAKESIDVFSNKKVEACWIRLFDELDNNGKGHLQYNEKFSLILDTIFKNVDIYRKQMDEQKELQEVIWQRSWLYEIKYRLLAEKKKLAIFPYGKVGRDMYQFLAENEILVDYIIDNYSEDEATITVDEVEKMDAEQLLVLVCNNNPEMYFEIRDEIEKVIPKNNIIDIFPRELLAFDYGIPKK